MLEYLIRRTGGEWFSFPFAQYLEILRPARTPSTKIEGWGSNRIEVDGETIAFSDEDPGFQVIFETGILTEQRAAQIISEICENIEAQTGEKAGAVKL